MKQTKMKKQLFLTVVLCLMLQVTSFGQSIKLNNQNDPGSAMLEVSSASKGILIPNVTLTGITDAITITLPAVSLLVYNTATVSDVEPGYYYNAGTIVSPIWTRLVTDAVSKAYADLLELRLKAYVDSLFNPIVQPDAPTIGTATAGAGQATINYTAPGSNGGATITSYTATSSPDGITGTVTQATSGTITVLGLTVGTPYTFTVTATNAEGTSLASTASNAVTPKVFDILPSVIIGNQIWTDKNLDVSTYRDGTAIPKVDDATWSTLTTGAYCYYNNDSTTYAAIYGKLYNWYAINTTTNGNKNVCPTGWHVPTDGEWDILRDHLDPAANGNTNIAGGKMKEAGLAHWITPNTGATNESGFSGLPGGFRFSSGTFNLIGSNGYWWSSAEYNSTNAWYRNLNNSNGNVSRNSYYKGSGFSVRCLRD
jgi:uncharacterized protein (TIGR02145 family)